MWLRVILKAMLLPLTSYLILVEAEHFHRVDSRAELNRVVDTR